MVHVGLDIGGTKIAALVADGDLQPLATLSRPTDAATPDRLVAGIVEAVDGALAAAGTTRRSLSAIGAGIPGQVDTGAGTVHMAVNLNLRAPFALGPALSAALGVPVALENDVSAASLGAFRWARERAPVDSLAYLSIGTGIAAGVILAGRLYRGAHGMAGEIGHMPLDPGGPRCACGNIGCFEVLAAGPAVAAAAAARRGPEAMAGLPAQPLTTGQVYQLAAAGDPTANQVVERAADFTARGIYLLALAYDVERIVVGGGVTRSGAAFEQPLRAALARLCADSGLAALMLPDDRVVVLPESYSAGMWGAVMLTQQAQTAIGASPTENGGSR